MMSKMINPNAPSRKRRANESNGPHVPNPAWNIMSEDYVDAYAEHDYRESHLNNHDPEKVAKTLAAIEDLQKRYRGHAAASASARSGAGAAASGVVLPPLSKLTPAARDVVSEQFHFCQALASMRYGYMTRDDAREMLKECGLETQTDIGDDLWTCSPVHFLDQELVTDRDEGSDSDDDGDEIGAQDADDEPVERALVRLGTAIQTKERDEELDTLLEDHFRVEVFLDNDDDNGHVAVREWFVVLI